jgi:hypothetical protein
MAAFPKVRSRSFPCGALISRGLLRLFPGGLSPKVARYELLSEAYRRERRFCGLALLRDLLDFVPWEFHRGALQGRPAPACTGTSGLSGNANPSLAKSGESWRNAISA